MTTKKSTIATILIALMMLMADTFEMDAQSTGVYVGGHIRRERPGTITTLKHSGFTYVILFNVNVETDGTLTTDGETICKDGQYVFGNTQPNYVSDVKALKTTPTSISRIEICIGGWGNESYNRIKTLINNNGTGSGTILYRNFKALKDAIPEIDAVNNDDESCYDVSTAVRFHSMMYDLGYKTSVAPYMNYNFWNSLVSQLGNKCDRVLIQCYDGGAGNNPSDWHLNNVTLHAGRTNYQSDMSTSVNQMQSWKNSNGVSGGFVWVYNDETWNLNAWGAAMNRVFGVKTTDRGVATFCADSDYNGYNISLPEGTFTQADLALYGITGADVSSLKVKPGYKVTMYSNVDLTGDSKTWTADASFVGSDWNDKARSVRIEPNGKSGLSGIWKIRNRNSGLYLDLDNNKTDNWTAIVQWSDEGTEDFQQWELQEISNGVYAILAASNTARGMDVNNASADNGTQVLLYDYVGEANQQFILYEKESGYYQLLARHCGKAVEIPSSSTNEGEWIKLWDNNGTNTQQWSLEHNTIQGYGVATFYKDVNYGGSYSSLPEGTYTTTRMKMFGINDNDITALKVTPGFKVTCYTDDNFEGESISYTSSTGWVGDQWNDKFSSLRIEACGTSGLDGKFKIQGYNSQLFWNIDNGSANDNALLQQSDENTSAAQQFRIREKENGVYYIMNLNSGKYIDVQDASTENGAALQQYTEYPDNQNQQFIFIDKGDGYYQIAARYCGKVIEIPDNGLNSGEFLKTGANNNQKYSWWKVAAISDDYSEDITDNGGTLEASHTAVKDAESISKVADDNHDTKYCANITVGDQVWLVYTSTKKAKITSYTLTSANDAPERDPMTWMLQGSNDGGTTWTTLDSRSNELFPERFLRKTYDVAESDAYTTFRLLVTALNGSDAKIFQLAEWQLFGEEAEMPTAIGSIATSDAKLSVYPNPATQYIIVQQAKESPISIYDMAGRCQLTTNGKEGTQRIDISQLPDGTYVVRVANQTAVLIKR